ncbi:glycosyltransferase family 2 protein [Changchengzhania lutea]|uniref:glycosyltransferase family 2 protein n=1 Tax=Changchengzhania lutea TaxID=2049305 RepID=UPI00115D537B|nr:glycosyltransferase family 2 protein [Changchengzhania lutea]
MKLSIVILNYNVRYFLELCLKSVEASLININAEIIVVDNNSEDGSCEMVKTTFPNVKLIENKENYGFSKGNNIGVAEAKGLYICILNPDTVVAEDTFLKLLAFADSTENLGIVGCRLINGAGDFLLESKRNTPYVKAAFKKLIGNPEDYYANHLKDNDIGKTDVLVGAFMLLKRSVFNEINGFDEDYFMYGEDIDMSYKSLKAGFDNYYFGKTSIIHFKGESTLRDKFYAKRFYSAMQIFYKKHFKKNILFDMFVWFGIRFVYVFRKKPVKQENHIERYYFVSDTLSKKVSKKLRKDVIFKMVVKDIEPNSEIIFDANYISYKEIISNIGCKNQNQSITFKILPCKSDFIIGSNDTISKGEVISIK